MDWKYTKSIFISSERIQNLTKYNTIWQHNLVNNTDILIRWKGYPERILIYQNGNSNFNINFTSFIVIQHQQTSALILAKSVLFFFFTFAQQTFFVGCRLNVHRSSSSEETFPALKNTWLLAWLKILLVADKYLASAISS